MEKAALAAQFEGVLPSGTTGKSYLKYDSNVPDNPSKPNRRTIWTTPNKKELRFQKALRKDNESERTLPLHILAQLVNIPARIILYALLQLLKSTREAFREAPADLKTFLAQISGPSTSSEDSYPSLAPSDEANITHHILRQGHADQECKA